MNKGLKLVSFTKYYKQQSNPIFQLSSTSYLYSSSYEYLGFVLHENVSFAEGRNMLADSAGRVLGSVMNKILCWPWFSNFFKMVWSVVGSFLFHAVRVWGFRGAPEINSIQSLALKCFLGVSVFTPFSCIQWLRESAVFRFGFKFRWKTLTGFGCQNVKLMLHWLLKEEICGHATFIKKKKAW